MDSLINSVDSITQHITVRHEFFGSKRAYCVDARQVHTFLCLSRPFRAWFAAQSRGFLADKDYTTYSGTPPGQTRTGREYLLALPAVRKLERKLPRNARSLQLLDYIKEVEAGGVASPDGRVLDVVDKRPVLTRAPLTTASAISIPVTKGTIGGIEGLVVDARDLHQFLGVGKMFAHWVGKRLADNYYLEGKDYELNRLPIRASEEASPKRGGQNAATYRLTLQAAKEIAMMERNEQGRAVRNYFIDCERQLQSADQARASAAQLGQDNANSGRAAATRLVPADSLVSTPAEHEGFLKVFLARQEELAVQSGRVYADILALTEDPAVATLAVRAFTKNRTRQLHKILADCDHDCGTPEGLEAMLTIVRQWGAEGR